MTTKLSCEDVAWKAFYQIVQGNALGLVYGRVTLWKSKSIYIQLLVIAFAPSSHILNSKPLSSATNSQIARPIKDFVTPI